MKTLNRIEVRKAFREAEQGQKPLQVTSKLQAS